METEEDNFLSKNRITSYLPKDRNIYPFPTDPSKLLNSKPLPSKTFVRWMIRKDLPEVEVISKKPISSLENLLTITNNIGIVLEINDKIEGYCIYQINPSYIKITHLAVSQENKKQKTEYLINYLINKIEYSNKQKLIFNTDENILDYKEVTYWLAAKGFIANYVNKGSNQIEFSRYNYGNDQYWNN